MLVRSLLLTLLCLLISPSGASNKGFDDARTLSACETGASLVIDSFDCPKVLAEVDVAGYDEIRFRMDVKPGSPSIAGSGRIFVGDCDIPFRLSPYLNDTFINFPAATAYAANSYTLPLRWLVTKTGVQVIAKNSADSDSGNTFSRNSSMSKNSYAVNSNFIKIECNPKLVEKNNHVNTLMRFMFKMPTNLTFEFGISTQRYTITRKPFDVHNSTFDEEFKSNKFFYIWAACVLIPVALFLFSSGCSSCILAAISQPFRPRKTHEIKELNPFKSVISSPFIHSKPKFGRLSMDEASSTKSESERKPHSQQLENIATSPKQAQSDYIIDVTPQVPAQHESERQLKKEDNQTAHGTRDDSSRRQPPSKKEQQSKREGNVFRNFVNTFGKPRPNQGKIVQLSNELGNSNESAKKPEGKQANDELTIKSKQGKK